MKDEFMWWCRNCECEFSLEDPNIKILRQPTYSGCIVEDEERRAHSLAWIKRTTVLRREFLNATAQEHTYSRVYRAEEKLEDVLEEVAGPVEQPTIDEELEKAVTSILDGSDADGL
jgi:hypothetical protein